MQILAAILMLAGALLAFPAAAGAKFTCEERGQRPQGFVLRGLPAAPVAERAYPLTVTLLRRRNGVNPTPYLGAERCGAGGLGGAGGWFRRAAGDRYVLSLSFSGPGRWALSFMDRGGTFYDLGVRRVEAPGRAHWFATPVERVLGPCRAAADQRP
jgi:hypothetical protein